MSQPNTFLAVACVADSSLAVASEWSRILAEYLAPLFARLTEAHQCHNQFRLAFITYGLDSSRPNPLLCERFFQLPGQIQQELKEKPAKLGIGQTGMGATSGGMAALEGIVAALEMFEKLRSAIGLNSHQTSNKRPTLVSHIIHFAACPPDASLNPMWNKDPNFDDLTWRTLPIEFKKRDINYSMILVRQVPRFKEIHALMPSTESCISPWFSVAPQHTILLSGFPSKGIKRPIDSTSVSSEQKRPRRDSIVAPAASNNSPNAPPNSSPDVSTDSASTSQHPSSSVSAPAAAPTSPSAPRERITFAQLPAIKQQQFIEQYRRIQIAFRQGIQAIEIATREGKSQELINNMKSQLNKKSHIGQRLGALLEEAGINIKNLGIPMPPAIPVSASAPQLQSQTDAPAGVNIGSSMSENNITSRQDMVPVTRSEPQGLNTSTSPMMPVNRAYPPGSTNNLVGQQQQQQNLNRQDITANIGSSAPQVAQLPKWQGTLNWGGPDPVTHDRRDMMVTVAGQCIINGTDPQMHTWPTNIHLTPSQDKLVAPQDFQIWVKKLKPVVCQITPLSLPGVDPQMNEMSFRQLIQMLIEKRVYALAAWDLPNGNRNSTNFLLYPLKGGGLVGVIFPTTGIPEMPKQMPNQVQFMDQYNRMSPEKQAAVKQWFFEKRAAAMATASGGNTSPTSMTNDGLSGATGIGNAQFLPRLPVGAGGSDIGITASMNNQSVQHARPAHLSTGGVPGVSTEMMQSFMQRKVDASTGQSGGMV